MKSFKEFILESIFPKSHPDNWKMIVKNRPYLKQAAIESAKKDHAQVTDDGFIVLYHGTRSGKPIIKSGMLRQGTYLTPNFDVAEQFSLSNQAKGKAEVTTVIVDAQAIMPSGNGYYSINEPVYFMHGRYIVEPESE